MSPELVRLAEGDAVRVGWLELADMYVAATPLGRRYCSAKAYRSLSGTPGQELVAWEDLTSAVHAFREWDFVADGHAPDIPSRERVAEDIVAALEYITRLGAVA